jgi:molecular chaperone DnaJ
MAQDFYELLGVPRDADADTIKRAYRQLARTLHPDVNADPEAAERFKEVSIAYEVLSDATKRRTYDRGGNPLGGGGGGFGQGFSFDDIMDAFFGQTSSRGPRPRMQRGQDALLRMTLQLAEAAFGATREIKVDTAVVCDACSGSGSTDGAPVTCGTCHGHGSVQQVQRSLLGDIRTARPCPTCQGYGTVISDPCPECAGDGRVRARRTLTVKVPPGVDHGTRIQLVNEGEVGPGGGPAGDLYVEIRVERHPVFTRSGDTLECQVTIPMTAAALGTTLDLPTLEADLGEIDGPETVSVEIPEGIQSGEVVLVRGVGIPHRSVGRGDLHVRVVVETPGGLDDPQRELLRQLASARDEERTEARLGATHRSVFGRIKDAFK